MMGDIFVGVATVATVKIGTVFYMAMKKIAGRQVSIHDNVLCTDGVVRQVVCLTSNALTHRTSTFRVKGMEHIRLFANDYVFDEKADYWN